MIDPKEFITAEPTENKKMPTVEGTFSCPEQGCYEVVTEADYDEENKKAFWTCPNGHDGGARYERAR